MSNISARHKHLPSPSLALRGARALRRKQRLATSVAAATFFACSLAACSPIKNPNPVGVTPAPSASPGGSGASGGNPSGGNNAPDASSLLGTWGICRASSDSVGNLRIASESEEYTFTATSGELKVTSTRFEQANCMAGAEFDREIQTLSYVQGASTASGATELDLQFRSLNIAAVSARAAAELSRIRYYGVAQWVPGASVDVTGRGEGAGAAPRMNVGLSVYTIARMNGGSISLGVGTVDSGNTYDGSTQAKRFRALGAEKFLRIK